MKNEPSFGGISDGWSNIKSESFVNLLLQFIDSEWKMKTVCVAAERLKGRQLRLVFPISLVLFLFFLGKHTAERLTPFLLLLLKKVGVEPSRVISMTTDNGGNFVNAVKAVFVLFC